MAAALERIAVEVAYALPERQWLVRVEIEAGATAREALRAAARLPDFPQLPDPPAAVALWGERVGLDQVLKDGDRVELLRPLRIDPRLARRELAAQGFVMGRQDRDEISSD